MRVLRSSTRKGETRIGNSQAVGGWQESLPTKKGPDKPLGELIPADLANHCRFLEEIVIC